MTALPEPAAPLGRVVATERRPNTPHEFHFWTALASPVGIGTIVRVDGRPVDGVIPHIYGIVVEGLSYTHLMSPLHDVIGHDGLSAGYADGSRGDSALHGSGASPDRRAAAARAVGRSFSRPRRMSPSPCAWTTTCAMGTELEFQSACIAPAATRHLPRRGFPRWPRARLNITGVSALPRGRRLWVDAVVDLRALPATRVRGCRVLQRQGPDLCFLDQVGTRRPRS